MPGDGGPEWRRYGVAQVGRRRLRGHSVGLYTHGCWGERRTSQGWLDEAQREDTTMTDTIALEIPRELPHATRMSMDDLRLELAIHLFTQDRLSFGKARELAGVTAWRFLQILGARGIALHYDVSELEEDLATIGRLEST